MSKKKETIKNQWFASRQNQAKKNFQNNWSFFMASMKPRPCPLDYAIWSILENKTNVISHPDIQSLKIAIEEEWNKMSEGFIWFGLVSLFNGISTFVGYLMPKPFS